MTLRYLSSLDALFLGKLAGPMGPPGPPGPSGTDADLVALTSQSFIKRGTLPSGTDLGTITAPGTYLMLGGNTYGTTPPGMDPAHSHWFRVYSSGNATAMWHEVDDHIVIGSGAGAYRLGWVRRIEIANPTNTTGIINAWSSKHPGASAVGPANNTIVLMGDSTIEGGGGQKWDTAFRARTGADVTNVAVGGSRMAGIGNTYYTPFSFYELSRRIRYGDWSVLTAAADRLFTDLGSDKRPQAAAMAAMDWSAVDQIICGYGTNDFRGSDPNGVPIGVDTDMTSGSLVGGMNAGITNILTAYPQIQFLFTTPLWRFDINTGVTDSDINPNGAGLYLRDYAAAIIRRADAFHTPSFDLHAESGVNALTRSVFIHADGLHPWTTPGTAMMASKITSAYLARF